MGDIIKFPTQMTSHQIIEANRAIRNLETARLEAEIESLKRQLSTYKDTKNDQK